MNQEMDCESPPAPIQLLRGIEMVSSQADKMHVLGMIYCNDEVPATKENAYILFELLEDDMIVNSNESLHLTYFGFRELENWDPVLRVSINDQLLQVPYGEA
jgi:hypothetical protein